ncbi:membrane hypothetical protein [Vibrio chagasii]|nr:membrane hypothetical protein [Vibrio chagasii]
MLSKSLATDIFGCSSWVKSQVGTVLGITSMSFITLWLEDRGASVPEILQAFSLLYFVTLIPFVFKRSVVITSVLLIVSSIGLLFAPYVDSVSGVSVFTLSLCLFVATVQSARDLFYVDLMSAYTHLSVKHNLDTPNVVAATMFLGVLVTSVCTPLIGILSAGYSEVYFMLLGFVGIGLTWGLLVRKDINGESTPLHVETKELPISIHWLCSLSTLVNIVTFFVRFFVLPMSLLHMAKTYGLEDSVLVVSGSLIGVMSIVAFVFKGAVSADKYRRDMYVAIGLVLLSCFLIGCTPLIGEFGLTLSAIIFLCGYVLLEVFSKVWTINFIAHLKHQAGLSGVLHESYMAFARYKAAGGFIGFLVAYALYGYLDVVQLAVLLTLVVAVAVVAISLSRKDMLSF